MKFSVTFITLAGIATGVSAAPAELQKRACTNPVLRKNWNSATSAEKTSYINAVKCLATKPSVLGTNATLFDDFTVVHRDLDTRIHQVASFLPWHRYFMQVYEDRLKQCGYTGNMLYWDFVASSDTYSNILDDPIFSGTTGVGGNGKVTSDAFGRCLQDGPFTQLRPVYWDQPTTDSYSPHCVTRQFYNDSAIPGLPPNWVPRFRIAYAEQYNSTVLNSLYGNTVFQTFSPAFERGIHGQVHTGVGGEMRRFKISTNDPLFFLFHTGIDRIWWLWQQKDIAARAYDISGTELGGVPTSLDYVLKMNGLAPDRTVRDFMVSNNDYQCFKY